jgi:hypothetical protein
MKTLIIAPVLFLACSAAVETSAMSVPAPTPAPTDVSAPTQTDRETRVQAAHEHLDASDGGKALRVVIDAHGGLDTWFESGGLAFDFNYLPEGAPERRMFARSEVDTWSVHVRQTELGDDADAILGWDGRAAWITPSASTFPAPAAFWATTPDDFVGIPWVLADPGTSHILQDTVALPVLDGSTRTVNSIRVTYDPGTGQAPDDYYVVHSDADTGELVALRYIVTDPTVRGADAPPPRETLFFFSQRQTIGGLVFAGHYDGFWWDDGQRGERKSTVDVTNIDVTPTISLNAFAPPNTH